MVHGIHDDRYLSLLSSNGCGGSEIVYVILAVERYKVTLFVHLLYQHAHVRPHLLSTPHDPFELQLPEGSESFKQEVVGQNNDAGDQENIGKSRKPDSWVYSSSTQSALIPPG